MDLSRPAGGPEWLRRARAEAADRFEHLELPTGAENHWRYSRIDELDLDRYQPLSGDAEATGVSAAGPLPEPLAPFLEQLGPVAALALVHDGRVTTLDSGEGTNGVTVSRPGDSEWRLGEVAGEPDAFVTLNSALGLTPLRIQVAAGAAPRGSIVVVHWVESNEAAHFPRLLVEIGPGAEASLIEVVASADVDSLVVPVTEVDVGAGANARTTTIQLLGPRAWQIGYQASRVERDATLTSATVALGGDYARNRIDSSLTGRGASGRLLAVWFGAGEQMPDLRTVQDHRAPNTNSELLFKGVVTNRSHSVYTGLIHVEKGAVGTNAMQTNRNLVLHEGASADSVPNLEIEDNDVRCSHASAVGPIDPDQRFYLESRGVPPAVGDRLIALGFLDEVLAAVPAQSLVPWLRLELARKLEAAEAEQGADQ
jgi:Fe-S cluster assembly protein SufD